MLELLLAAIALGLFLLALFLLSRVSTLEKALEELRFSKSSQSVKYGKMTEQFIPFTKDFPFSPEEFRFIGNPIDGVVFGSDKIVFAEFKSSSSQLSEKQKRVRKIVQQKKVEWYEHRID